MKRGSVRESVGALVSLSGLLLPFLRCPCRRVPSFGIDDHTQGCVVNDPPGKGHCIPWRFETSPELFALLLPRDAYAAFPRRLVGWQIVSSG